MSDHLHIDALPVQWGQNSEIRLVAWEGGLAGVATLVNVGKVAATIVQLYVRPESRGQGIGSHLVQAAEGVARQRQSKAVSAIVEDGAAAQFWASLGYRPAHVEGGNVLVSKQL